MKRFLFLSLMALLSLNTSAQSFDFYGLAGPVLSQIDGDRVGGYDKMGFTLGAGVSRRYDDQWSGLLELSYIQKGKGSYNESDGSTYKIRLNYMQVPLAARYQLSPVFSLETGLSMAFLFSYQFFENGENNNEHRPYTPYWYDLDWLLGASYVINDEWTVNLRFTYSIFPMGDRIEEDTYRPNLWQNPGGQYNHSLALALQYWW